MSPPCCFSHITDKIVGAFQLLSPMGSKLPLSTKMHKIQKTSQTSTLCVSPSASLLSGAVTKRYLRKVPVQGTHLSLDQGMAWF